MSTSYYLNRPVPFSECVDGRLQQLGIEIIRDETGYVFFDGSNWMSACIVGGSLRGFTMHGWDDVDTILEGVVHIWKVVVFSDLHQPFEVVAAPDEAAGAKAQAECKERWIREDWTLAQDRLSRDVNAESVPTVGRAAVILAMAQQIVYEQPDRKLNEVVDEAVERLVTQELECVARGREPVPTTERSETTTELSDRIRARLGMPVRVATRVTTFVQSSEFEGDFHFFRFGGPSTVCVYVISEEEQQVWATVVDPGAAQAGCSALDAALVRFVGSSGLMRGSELDNIVVLTCDEYEALARRIVETHFPHRCLLDHVLGKTQKSLEAYWTQREDRVWVKREAGVA
jgi:hypothetical protein